MPGLAQDAVHHGSSLKRNSHMFARKIEKGQCSLVVVDDVLMSDTELLRFAHKQILSEVVGDRRVEIMVGR